MNGITTTAAKFILSASALTLLVACGGGGDGSSSPTGGGSANADNCSVVGQNEYFLDYMRDDYFWYNDIPNNIDPSDYNSVFELLDAIRSPIDRFSYVLTEAEYQSRFVDAEYIGFGLATRTLGNRLLLNYVYPDSPAAQAGMQRADEITAIDGTSVATLIANGSLNQALGAKNVGVTVEFTWQRPDGTEFTELVSKTEVETNTVLAIERFTVGERDVGYYVLNSFIDRTGADLNNAYDALMGVDELVIDVRYNGGGLIRYANQASSQAAGNNVLGFDFVTLLFNDKNTTNNYTSQFELIDGVRQLDLDRVFVLTTGASCSSSELLINSLKPFIEVVVIGQPTCGKPVGQSPQPFCDKRSFVINFETVNAEGEGRYFDGIAPTCQANDNLVADWGQNGDPLLDEARFYMLNSSCSAVSAASSVVKENTEQGRRHPLLEQWANEF